MDHDYEMIVTCVHCGEEVHAEPVTDGETITIDTQEHVCESESDVPG